MRQHLKVVCRTFIMEFKRFLRGDIHGETLMLFAITLFGSMLPLIFGVLMASVFRLWDGWGAFLNNGELYLYGAGFYTQAMYALYYQRQGRVTGLGDILFWFSFGIFVISAFLYGALATSLSSRQFVNSGIQFDSKWLYTTSIISLCFSLLMFYISSYIAKAMEAIDVREEENEDVEQIKRDFNPE